ncbi:hypothetical protein PTUN_a3551 [Pseudoalteromonas tunicata]|nr:hypothetical protein PTUN_a3551 [Pseudoalteromonas tunicata]
MAATVAKLYQYTEIKNAAYGLRFLLYFADFSPEYDNQFY